MARIIPALDDSELRAVKSAAEVRFYRHCRDRLPSDWTVLYSVPWVRTSLGGQPRDGEADFVVLVPDKGMLVVEVKGGGVEFNPARNEWYSTNAEGKTNLIKDPFVQAKGEKFAVLGILHDDPKWRLVQPGKITIGHAVLLADIDRLDGVVGPNSPREILGGRVELEQSEKWILSVLGYWRSSGDEGRRTELNQQGIGFIESVLFKRLQARPLLATRLADEERMRITLTEQQSRILRVLGAHKKAVIVGGAGTGKTLLALERARMCAERGMKTLLLTYNRLLADHLKQSVMNDSQIAAMSFHQLCEWRSAQAGKASGRDLIAEAREAFPARGGSEYFDQQLPYALALSTEVLADRFDAIIVDEAQDFRPEYWAGIELLLTSEADGYLYIFCDPNQALYSKALALPITDAPFALTSNCRNTESIHAFSYRFFKGDITDPPRGNSGVPIDFIESQSTSSQASDVHSRVVQLIAKEGLGPTQIAVLVCGQPKSAYYDALSSKPLPRGVVWSFEGAAASDGVRVDTVNRFKGLEADVVVLWGLDTIRSADRVETLYVGASRAKSRLHLIGRADVLRELR